MTEPQPQALLIRLPDNGFTPDHSICCLQCWLMATTSKGLAQWLRAQKESTSQHHPHHVSSVPTESRQRVLDPHQRLPATHSCPRLRPPCWSTAPSRPLGCALRSTLAPAVRPAGRLTPVRPATSTAHQWLCVLMVHGQRSLARHTQANAVSAQRWGSQWCQTIVSGHLLITGSGATRHVQHCYIMHFVSLQCFNLTEPLPPLLHPCYPAPYSDTPRLQDVEWCDRAVQRRRIQSRLAASFCFSQVRRMWCKHLLVWCGADCTIQHLYWSGNQPGCPQQCCIVL